MFFKRESEELLNCHLSPEQYKIVQELIQELSDMRRDDNILAIYLLKATESGRIISTHYKNRRGKLFLRPIIIMKDKNANFDFTSIPFFMDLRTMTDEEASIGFTNYTILYDGWKVFDKRYKSYNSCFKDYCLEDSEGDNIAYNRFLTDFKRMDYEEKKLCLAEEPNVPIDSELIGMVAVVHVLCHENFIDVKPWILKSQYKSKKKIGIRTKVSSIMKSHNVWYDREDFERV